MCGSASLWSYRCPAGRKVKVTRWTRPTPALVNIDRLLSGQQTTNISLLSREHTVFSYHQQILTQGTPDNWQVATEGLFSNSFPHWRQTDMFYRQTKTRYTPPHRIVSTGTSTIEPSQHSTQLQGRQQLESATAKAMRIPSEQSITRNITVIFGRWVKACNQRKIAVIQ